MVRKETNRLLYKNRQFANFGTVALHSLKN